MTVLFQTQNDQYPVVRSKQDFQEGNSFSRRQFQPFTLNSESICEGNLSTVDHGGPPRAFSVIIFNYSFLKCFRVVYEGKLKSRYRRIYF
jgi:hypothetical protein